MGFASFFGKKDESNLEGIKSDFVTLASHQLRTPLSAVKWYAEMLLSGRAGELSEKQLGYINEIARSNSRAINLVNDLLDVSRIQEGHIHLELRDVKVEGVIQEVMDNLSDIIRAGEVKVNFEIVNGPLPAVKTDAEKLKRIVVNLLSNAVKYTPVGGSVRVAVEQSAEKLTVTIADSGIGIPKADQKRVFDKFFRSQNVIRVSPDGTGLGLFITKSLVEAMGGKIWFESAEGKGTTFYFTLPLE